MAFTVDIRGNASHLEKTLGLAKGRLLDLGNMAKAGVTGLAGLGIAGAAGLGAFIISSSKAASNVESLTMQFETLLGSSDAAGKRMEEIVKFAASTPFEIAELAATSKQLQNAGGDILAIGDGLKMVGDAAAISGRPLEEVALHIGRVFGAMTSGTSAGESVGRLVEIGLITGDVKREFEALAVAQKKGTAATLSGEQALAKMQSVLSKTDGAMERLAATTEGKLSNMKDNIAQLKVAFGTGFNDGLKIALDATNNFLPQLQSKFTEAGQIVGGAITKAVQGNTDQLAAVGAFIGEVVLAGFKSTFLIGFDNVVAATKNANAAMRNELMSGVSLAIGGSGGQLDYKRAESPAASGRFQTSLDQLKSSLNLQTLQSGNATQQSYDYAKSQIEKEKIQQATKEGVKEGMKEVWYSLDQGGARFGN